MGVVSGTLLGTLTNATPLLLAAIGENVVQKAGVVNVGLEGVLLTGAFLGMLGARGCHDPYIGLACASLAGMLTAWLFAVFTVRLAANQVVVGVVVNLFALGLTGTLYRAIFGATGEFIDFKGLPAVLGDQTLLTPLALASVPLVWWWLRRTRAGLELRACGEQPVAAEAAGVDVRRVRWRALTFGGLLGGLAGAYLSVAQTHTFVENMTAGRGFIALAIVTSGRWSPWGCLAAALVFGLTETLEFQGQALGLRLPHQLFLALPYLATLAILAGGGRSGLAPAALGQPFRRA